MIKKKSVPLKYFFCKQFKQDKLINIKAENIAEYLQSILFMSFIGEKILQNNDKILHNFFNKYCNYIKEQIKNEKIINSTIYNDYKYKCKYLEIENLMTFSKTSLPFISLRLHAFDSSLENNINLVKWVHKNNLCINIETYGAFFYLMPNLNDLKNNNNNKYKLSCFKDDVFYLYQTISKDDIFNMFWKSNYDTKTNKFNDLIFSVQNFVICLFIFRINNYILYF